MENMKNAINNNSCVTFSNYYSYIFWISWFFVKETLEVWRVIAFKCKQSPCKKVEIEIGTSNLPLNVKRYNKLKYCRPLCTVLPSIYSISGYAFSIGKCYFAIWSMDLASITKIQNMTCAKNRLLFPITFLALNIETPQFYHMRESTDQNILTD